MMPIEKDEKILLEYGRSVLIINTTEDFLKQLLALEATLLNKTNFSDELKNLDTKYPMLGDKIYFLREKILSKTNCASLDNILTKTTLPNVSRIKLAHVASVESVQIDSEKKPHETGKYFFCSYYDKKGIFFPEEKITANKLSDIYNLACEVIQMIHLRFLENKK
jgi:hypothetical protein